MPGLWHVEGLYYDAYEKPHVQEGELLVEHAPDLWTIDSQMKISGQDLRDFNTRYEIVPFPEGVSYTEWKSLTGGPEPIYGLFLVIDNAIMMPWQSKSGQYWGQEVLFSQDEDNYLSRGFAFLKDKKVSSWAARMSRQS
jgi:hypothetical protein